MAHPCRASKRKTIVPIRVSKQFINLYNKLTIFLLLIIYNMSTSKVIWETLFGWWIWVSTPQYRLPLRRLVWRRGESPHMPAPFLSGSTYPKLVLLVSMVKHRDTTSRQAPSRPKRYAAAAGAWRTQPPQRRNHNAPPMVRRWATVWCFCVVELPSCVSQAKCF